jgi:hypothetical protein
LLNLSCSRGENREEKKLSLFLSFPLIPINLEKFILESMRSILSENVCNGPERNSL